MGCDACKKTECKKPESGPVPYIVFEAAQARNERAIKHLVVALIVALVMIFVSNACWLWAWMQYDYSGEETVVTQDGEGLNIYGDRNMADFYGPGNPD